MVMDLIGSGQWNSQIGNVILIFGISWIVFGRSTSAWKSIGINVNLTIFQLPDGFSIQGAFDGGSFCY